MITAVLLGMGFGAGVALLLRLVFPPRPPLAVALARVDSVTARPARSRSGSAAGSGLERRLQAVEFMIGDQLAGRLADQGLLGNDLHADLDLLEMDPSSYTARKLLLSAGTLVVAPVLLATAGTLLGLSWLAAAGLSVLLAMVVWVIPDHRVRAVAKDRRRDFTAATAAFLDLVAMRTASGSGIPEALRQAAGIGAGTAFERIRRALDDAQLSGRTSGASLTALGERLAVAELVQLGGQLQNMDEGGAQAEATLRAKADALRSRQLTEAQGKANASSQTMALAAAFLAIGFFIILGYPAFASVQVF